MKKILLLLLAFVSIQVYSQRTGTAEFDFSNPETLHGSGNFTVPTNPGETLINPYVFTEGQVSLSFSTAGNGCAIGCIKDYEENTLSYSLVVRGHGEMIVSIKGKGYALKSVIFDGSTGDLDNVNTAFNRWDANSDSETEIRFMNGTQHTAIRKLTVIYTRPPEDVKLWDSNPKDGGKVPSFSEMFLKFNLPVTIVKNDGFKFFELDDYGRKISESEKSLTASVSSEDEKGLTLRPDKEIKEDGKYVVEIEAGALKNVDNSLNAKMSVVFTIEIERNTLEYTSVSPDAVGESIPELPETITITYGQKVSIDENKAQDAVLHKENTNKIIPAHLEAKGSDVYVTYYNDGPLTEPGRWTLTIPEGSITNGSRSKKTLFYNPEIALVYTIENELTILQKQADELFVMSGGDEVLVGYPVKGSEGWTMLNNVVSEDIQAPIEDYKAAIDAFYNENDVLLPQAEKWYKIAGVNDGDTLYLVHQKGQISLTQDSQSASAFKAKTAQNEANVYAFLISNSDNYLHIGEMGSAGHNFSVESSIPQFSLSKFSIDGEQIAGLLKMEIEGGHSAALQFAGALSRGFMFVEASEEDNMQKPLAKLSSTTIDYAGDNLILTISNVGNIKLADKTKPYFIKDNQTIPYESDILIATNDSTRFQVRTNGLPVGVYTLVIPTGTFEYTNKDLYVKDESLMLVFEIKTNNDGRPNFNYTYSYNVLQYTTKNVNNMTSPDINDITLYAYVPDEYSDMIPDTTKIVEIVKSRTLSAVATGHFEIYPDSDFYRDYQIEHVKAVKLKLDKPFVLGDLKNDPGIYLCYIPEATFGDANFGKYLEDPTSVRPEDCIVNCSSSSFQFMIDDGNALNTPTAETFALAQKLFATHGVGYPSQDSAARNALNAKVDYVQGGEDVYQRIINNFYAEKDVEMPTDAVYYRVTAVSETENSVAYLTYDGDEVGLTDDVEKATGFKAVANDDGTFLLQTGDGRYLKQISEAGNVSVTATAANKITLEKLSIEGVEAKKTFGTLSIKAENKYMYVDIANLAFLTPSGNPDSIVVEHTNAFKFEEIDKSKIYAPEVSMNFNIAHGANVESLKSIIVTFVGAAKVDLADKSKIKINSATEKNVGKIEVVPTDRGNEFILTFSDLPESPSYMLNIGDGAFTFTFAEVKYTIEGDAILINISPTGISAITITESDEPLYDLQGRKVSGNLKSGIYIKNGKKVYIK